MGLVLGLATAYALAQAARSILYGVAPHDPLTLTAATTVVLSVSLAASWVPMQRALSVDPAGALRGD